MKLSGNAPFLVFDDADVDAAVDGAMLAMPRSSASLRAPGDEPPLAARAPHSLIFRRHGRPHSPQVGTSTRLVVA